MYVHHELAQVIILTVALLFLENIVEWYVAEGIIFEPTKTAVRNSMLSSALSLRDSRATALSVSKTKNWLLFSSPSVPLNEVGALQWCRQFFFALCFVHHTRIEASVEKDIESATRSPSVACDCSSGGDT